MAASVEPTVPAILALVNESDPLAALIQEMIIASTDWQEIIFHLLGVYKGCLLSSTSFNKVASIYSWLVFCKSSWICSSGASSLVSSIKSQVVLAACRPVYLSCIIKMVVLLWLYAVYDRLCVYVWWDGCTASAFSGIHASCMHVWNWLAEFTHSFIHSEDFSLVRSLLCKKMNYWWVLIGYLRVY